jgi:hypothetical protein
MLRRLLAVAATPIIVLLAPLCIPFMGVEQHARAAPSSTLRPPTGWIILHPTQETVSSLQDLSLNTNGESFPANAHIEMPPAHWEIRTADNKYRIAEIPLPANRFADIFRSQSGYNISRDELRAIPSLPTGTFLVACIVDKERCSNVIRFNIDPKHEAAHEAYIHVLQLEPIHAGNLPTIIYYVTRRTQADPAPDQMTVAGADLVLDGTLHRRSIIAGTGPNAPQGIGESYRGGFGPDDLMPFLGGNLDKPHSIAIRLGERQSAPVNLQTGTPLADAWDRATPTLSPPPITKTSIIGTLRTAGPLQLCVLTLEGQNATFTDRSDEDGHFYFRNLFPGKYVLTCAPKGSPNQSFSKSAITIKAADQEPVSIDLSLSSAQGPSLP